MNVAIYRILNLGAKDWPPHAGDRAAQRASIRSALKTVRLALATEGGHVSIGHGGASVHYAHEPGAAATLSGYSLTHCYTALAAMVAGAPWVDTRPVADVGRLIRAPMIACGRAADPRPWHGLSFAPRAHVFETLRRLGAHLGEGRNRP